MKTPVNRRASSSKKFFTEEHDHYHFCIFANVAGLEEPHADGQESLFKIGESVIAVTAKIPKADVDSVSGPD